MCGDNELSRRPPWRRCRQRRGQAVQGLGRGFRVHAGTVQRYLLGFVDAAGLRRRGVVSRFPCAAINTGKLRRLVVITVNARSEPPSSLDQQATTPGVVSMVGAVTSNPIDAATASIAAQRRALLSELRTAAMNAPPDALFGGVGVYDRDRLRSIPARPGRSGKAGEKHPDAMDRHPRGIGAVGSSRADPFASKSLCSAAAVGYRPICLIHRCELCGDRVSAGAAVHCATRPSAWRTDCRNRRESQLRTEMICSIAAAKLSAMRRFFSPI